MFKFINKHDVQKKITDLNSDLCSLKEILYMVFIFFIFIFAAFKSNYPVFLAHLSSRSSKTPVIFDKTHSSYHHGYSVRTGAFTADRDGVYLFLYNIEACNEIVRTTLRVNGIEKFETRSDGRHSFYDDTSAVTVLELSVNDQVSVGVKDGTVDSPESLFFGVLLIEM